MDERKSRFGQEGYAQVAERLQAGKMGVAGEREKEDEVVDGGESVDFKGMLMGFMKEDCSDGTDDVEEVGESDTSLLLSSQSMWCLEKGEAMVRAECGDERYLVESNMKTLSGYRRSGVGWGWGRGVGIWGRYKRFWVSRRRRIPVKVVSIARISDVKIKYQMFQYMPSIV